MLGETNFILPAVAALIVLAILLFGIATFARGGEFNRRHANRIMRWRLYAQLAAVVVIVALAWWRARGHG